MHNRLHYYNRSILGTKMSLKKYIENQGKETKYQKVHKTQLTLFDC